MASTSLDRIGAGLSLLFAPGERPRLDALLAALEDCQTQATIAHVHPDRGAADVIVSGLIFEVDGLAVASLTDISDDLPSAEAEDAIRLFPGHSLSGGLSLAPVSRALLALAAELAVNLPVQAVRWHPGGTTSEASAFSRSVLAWLVGGSFPAAALVELTPLADGSVASCGLAHFVGQEVTVRGGDGIDGIQLAGAVVNRLVRDGPLAAFTQWRLLNTLMNAEPARQAKQILVWRAD